MATVRKELEGKGQVSRLDTSQGKDGKEYPRQRNILMPYLPQGEIAQDKSFADKESIEDILDLPSCKKILYNKRKRGHPREYHAIGTP